MYVVQGTQKQFKEIIDATSEDSSSCGHQPVTFIRQVHLTDYYLTF